MNHETARVRAMSRRDLVMLGLNDMAYVKAARDQDGGTAYEIHAADGTLMAVVEDRDVAFATIRQNDLEPVSTH